MTTIYYRILENKHELDKIHKHGVENVLSNFILRLVKSSLFVEMYFGYY